MNHFHIITSTFLPNKGGMEESIDRIATFLEEKGNIVTIYVKKGTHEGSDKHVYLSTLVRKLLRINETNSEYKDEYNRLEYLVIKNEISRRLSTNHFQRNFIVSFFCSSAGFLGQKIALDFAIPHICSIRGSDINVFTHNRTVFNILSFVIKKSDYIIATSEEQVSIVRNFYNRYDNTSVIHNSIPQVGLLPYHRPNSNGKINIFTDIGFSPKKGLLNLLLVLEKLKKEGLDFILEIAGNTNNIDFSSIKELISNRCSIILDNIRFLGELNKEDIYIKLSKCSFYIHPSLGEGCSNARIAAYCIGVPVLTTETGEAIEFKKQIKNIYTYYPTDLTALENAITNIIKDIKNGISYEITQINKMRDYFTIEREKSQWEKVISLFTKKKDSVIKFSQKRILFYVHDGTGLGHLRRVARIAKTLQGAYSCLILSGHRYQSNIVDESCEFVHIPSLDSLVERNSRYWGRKPFMDISIDEVKEFRSKLIQSVVEAYKPDAIFVDFLPLGKFEEIKWPIYNWPCRKYFLLRGILDDPSNVRIDILGGNGEYALEKHFDKIIVTCDPKIINVSKEYNFSSSIADKIVYSGYVSPKFSEYETKICRLERGLKSNEIYVVCSAGGGKLGEKLIAECIALSKIYKHIKFDIVLGPKSNLNWHRLSINQFEEDNVRYFYQNDKLELLHASADIIINPGGYNSLVETLQGTGVLITVPVQLRSNDEQFIHSAKISEYAPQVLPIKSTNELAQKFEDVINNLHKIRVCVRGPLDFNGAEKILHILNEDFSKENNLEMP